MAQPIIYTDYDEDSLQRILEAAIAALQEAGQKDEAAELVKLVKSEKRGSKQLETIRRFVDLRAI